MGPAKRKGDADRHGDAWPRLIRALADRIAAAQGPQGPDGHLRQRRDASRSPPNICGSTARAPRCRAIRPTSARPCPASAMSRSSRCMPVGNYAVRLVFDDLHSTGIFSWDYLLELGRNRAANWQDYLDELAGKGLSREPARAEGGAVAILRQACATASPLHDHLRADPHAAVEIDRRPRWSGGSSPTTPPGRSFPARSSRGCDKVSSRDTCARAPSGLSGPPVMWRGRSGRRRSICAGGVQAGHSFLRIPA